LPGRGWKKKRVVRLRLLLASSFWLPRRLVDPLPQELQIALDGGEITAGLIGLGAA
jgi:hypothetical protein